MFNFLKQFFCNHEYHKVKENTIAGTNEKVIEVKCNKCGACDVIFLE